MAVVVAGAAAPKLGYRPGLDGLRGIACLAVIFAHARPGPFRHAGMVGVELFFVLSGFLITTLLMEEHAATGGVSLRGFYERRVRRLMPALLVFTLVLLTVPWFGLMSPFDALAGLLYAGNVAELVGHAQMYPLNHVWSLAVEEHFYLLWPAALVVSRYRFVQVAAGAFVLSTVWRLVLLADGAELRRIYIGTDTRIGSIAVGCLAAYAFRNGLRLPAWVIPAGLTVLAVMSTRGEAAVLWSIPLLEVVCVGVVVAVASNRGRLENPALVWAGRLSYGLYLWHFAIFARLGILAELSPKAIVVGSALTLALTLASYWLIEMPVRRQAAARRMHQNAEPLVPLRSVESEPRWWKTVAVT